MDNPLVKESRFLAMPRQESELPAFEDARAKLPAPFWKGHNSHIDCYWKAWELAFKNLRAPTPENGFVSDYIDTAFNGCLFMWDSAFILMFGKYGRRAFDFLGTLNNFYAKQHPDGFICREISEADGEDKFHRFDPTSTGPNVMPWTEWEYYRITGDRARLADVLPALLAYHRWLRAYRTWPDGSYWSSGWATGSDNTPRIPGRFPSAFYHGHYIWVDACLQQIFSAMLLASMAEAAGRGGEAGDMREEAQRLTQFVNDMLWDETNGFYCDLAPGGGLSCTKHIGVYWALLAGTASGARLDRLVEHLSNGREFNRPHRIPSLAADHTGYKKEGEYWRGGVWAPANYMVLRGLSRAGRPALAYEIARNHVDSVVAVFKDTGTLWEYYAPEAVMPGGSPDKADWNARPDFVGWGGLPPIAVFLEYVLGLQADVPENRLVWNVHLLEEHGVERYPFGLGGTLSLRCLGRASAEERPRIEASSNVPVELVVRWGEESYGMFLEGRDLL